MRNQNLLVILIFTILTIVVFRPYFFKNQIPFPSNLLVSYYEPWKSYPHPDYPNGAPNKPMGYDNLRIYYPLRSLMTELIKKGQFPLWNPYSFSGTFLHATLQTVIFHPLSFLFFILPQIDAYSIIIILQPMLAGFFMYLFLKQLKLSFISTLLGSITYAFAGFMVVWWEEAFMVGYSGLFLPLALYSIEKNNLFLLVAGLVFSVFSGSLQITLYVWAFVLIWILYRKPKLIASLLIAFLISAIQLFPGIEAFLSSGRLAEAKYLFENQLLPLKHLITFLIPDFFGNPGAYNYFGSGFYHERMIFVGTIPFILIFLALFTKKLDLPHGKFFKIAFLITLSLGFSLPTSWLLLYHLKLPIVSTMSPTRIFTLTIFCAGVLAAYGLEQFKKGISKRTLFLTTIIIAASMLAAWAFAIYWRLIKPDSYQATVTFRNLILPTALVAFGLAGLWLRKAVVPLLFVLTFVGIFHFTNKFLYFSDRRLVFPDTPVLTKLKEIAGLDRFWTYDNGKIESNFAAQYRLFSPEGFDAITNWRYNTLLSYGSSTPRADALIPSIDHFDDILNNPVREKLLKLLAVKYILAPVRPDKNMNQIQRTDPRFSKVWGDGVYEIFQYIDVYPRAFLTGSYHVAQSGREVLKAVFDPNIDLSKTIILEEKIDLPQNQNIEGEAKILSYSPSRVVVQTTSDKPALLFLSDNFFPGWKATVDDQASKIYRADYAFRAVPLSSGQHNIIFTYQPMSFTLGLLGSAAGILLLSLYLFKRIINV